MTTLAGVTALIAASQNGHVEVVGLLLASKGVDVNKGTAADGATALMDVAAARGHRDLCRRESTRTTSPPWQRLFAATWVSPNGGWKQDGPLWRPKTRGPYSSLRSCAGCTSSSRKRPRRAASGARGRSRCSSSWPRCWSAACGPASLRLAGAAARPPACAAVAAAPARERAAARWGLGAAARCRPAAAPPRPRAHALPRAPHLRRSQDSCLL
jgi:hypothetical protein